MKLIGIFATCALLLGTSYRTPFEVKSSLSKSPSSALPQAIDALVAKHEETLHLGIEVVSLTTGERIYSKNAHHMFNPASAVKIYTAAAALELLGADYRFVTQLLYDGQIQQETLKGNLYIKGSGDPDFTVKEVEEFADFLSHSGIKEIDGNVIIDASVFDDAALGPGWMWDEPPAYWSSRVHGLTLNRNCIKVKIAASGSKRPPSISTEPTTQYLQVDFKPISNQGSAQRLECQRIDGGAKERIAIQGFVAPQDAKELYVSLAEPSRFAQTLVQETLEKRGIRAAKVQSGITPKNAQSLMAHSSRPLSLMIEEMLKYSDNLIANCIFKKLGNQLFKEQGTWKQGSHIVRKYLSARAGIAPSEIAISDGDGQSRYNLSTPHQFTQLLIHIKKQPYFPAFFSALPIVGIDNDLLAEADQDVKGRVWAKPGTMRGITSLVGYAESRKGEVFAFAVLANGFAGLELRIKKELESALCALLARAD